MDKDLKKKLLNEEVLRLGHFEQSYLAYLNDYLEYDFVQIADYIEQSDGYIPVEVMPKDPI